MSDQRLTAEQEAEIRVIADGKQEPKAKKDKPGSAIELPTPEPWPQPITDAAAVADQLLAAIRRHVAMSDIAAVAVALWIFVAHAHDAFRVSVILSIGSPTKRCGKTTLLGFVMRVVPRPLPTSNVTGAALFRVVQASCPTLLVDEIDTYLSRREELRGLINSGHTRDVAYVIRTVGEGANAEVRKFTTWAPKVIAGIGEPPDTVADRSIRVELRRREPGEHIEPLRAGENPYSDLARKIARWTEDNFDRLSAMDPPLPAGLHDRAADNWRGLVAIADVLGGEWPARARRAAEGLSGDVEDQSDGVLLLSDLRDLFNRNQSEALFTDTIKRELHAMEDRPWPEFGDQGKPISAPKIARLLRPFGIRPRSVRIDAETAKGYRREWFTEAWSRYAPVPPAESVTPSQPAPDAGLRDSQPVTPDQPVTDSNGRYSALQAECDGVTAPDPLLDEDDREAAAVAAVDQAIASGTLENITPEEWDRLTAGAAVLDLSENGGPPA